MSDRITVLCPKCGWQYHATEGALTAACVNPQCLHVLKLGKKGEIIEAKLGGEPGVGIDFDIRTDDESEST